MYSTCLFCNDALGSNGVVEHFPVGRRLAFDSAKGRLWAVCPRCGRWNLSPLDERWEAIEECERGFRSTPLRVSTDNIGLAKLSEGLELIRIGAPLRPEFAAWRYGGRLGRRRLRSRLVVGGSVAAAAAAGVAVGATLAPILAGGIISIIVVPGLTTIKGVIPMVGVIAARDYYRENRVIARIPRPVPNEGRVFAFSRRKALVIRARHAGASELRVDASTGEASLDVMHDGGWAHYQGTAAIHTACVLLAHANRHGASAGEVRDAVTRIEQHGDSSTFLAEASNRGASRGRIMSMLNVYRDLGALRLDGPERLALEMAMHEETERRALEGELTMLAEAWRNAEEIAAIADKL